MNTTRKPLMLVEVLSMLQDAYERYGNIPVQISQEDGLSSDVKDIIADEDSVIIYNYI